MKIVNNIKRSIFSKENTEVRNILFIFILSIPLIGITLFFVNEYSEEMYEYYKKDVDESYIEKEKGHLADVLSRSQNTDSFKYDLTAVSRMTGTNTGEFWQKGEKIKMEGEINGNISMVFLNSKEGKAHIYDVSQENILETDIENVADILDSSMKTHSLELLNKDPHIIAREKIEGKECLVVEYSEEGRTGKIWIWEDQGLPIKVNPPTINRMGVTSWEAKNIEFAELPDSVFEIPENVPITVPPVISH